MIKDHSGLNLRAEQTAKLLAALANPQRLLILCHLLQHGEAGAGALANHFGFSQSALSQHLARMRAEALVVQRREGRALFYRINDQLDAHLPALLETLCDPEPVDEPAQAVTRTAAAIGLAFASTLTLAGDDFWQAPAIRGAGQMHPLPHSAYQPDPDATYRVVFTLTRGSEHPAKVNPGLQRVARTVNLYAASGVPPDHLKFVAVASGPATAIALDDAHYRQQHGTANPNLPVIRELRRAGIDVAVCGQAIAEHQLEYDWVSRDVTLALSTLTTVTQLEQQGYTLMTL